MITFSEIDSCTFHVYEGYTKIGYIYRGMIGWHWSAGSLGSCLNTRALQQILDKVKEMNELTGEVEW